MKDYAVSLFFRKRDANVAKERMILSFVFNTNSEHEAFGRAYQEAMTDFAAFDLCYRLVKEIPKKVNQ